MIKFVFLLLLLCTVDLLSQDYAGYEKGLVLDPFVGAGNTIITALKLGRRAIGIETYDKYIEIINKRIEPIMKQTRLFI